MCVLKVQNFPISALPGLYDLQPSVLGGEDLGQIQIGIYPQHFQNILAACGSECDQTWEHTNSNTDVFMWLELYILWNIFPSNFIKFIFSLAPDHKLVQC